MEEAHRLPLPSRPGGASGRAVALAFVAVAVVFVTSTAVAEYNQVEIRRAAAQVTGNSAPSVQTLSAFRSDLRRFTLLADDEVDRGEKGQARESAVELAASRRSMDDAWAWYRTLPTFPGERELWPAADAARSNMEGAMFRLDDAMERGDWNTARAVLETELKPAADRLDLTVQRLVDINAGWGATLAARIDGLGRQSVLLATALDGISVLLTILTALMVWRVVRGYTSLVERRAEELELFAGRVAHDVLGPIGAATLALDVAEREAAPGGRTARIIASGRGGLRRARTIADGLLEFARAGAQPQPGARADVLEVVRAVVEEVQPEAQARQIALLVEAVQPGEVACSPGILSSVVSNLVRNAVKYVGEGPRRRVTIRARPAGTRVRLEVEDNGHGLPEGLGEHVFEPYVRGGDSKEPGIGLGLATVKKITEAHGGTVDVRSVTGLGCRFGIELPAAPALPVPRGGGGGAARLAAPARKGTAVDRPPPAH
jgi:signal transduction histidine kinase